MSRIRPAGIVAGALICALACTGEQPTASKVDSPPETKPAPAVAVEREGVSPASRDGRPPPPPWFDEAKIEHAKVLNKSASDGPIAGGYATAMVLELQPEATTERCIELVQAAMSESLPDRLPAPSVGDDGRQTIQGQADGYHYTVVCGEAKGKPTLYLSYTAN